MQEYFNDLFFPKSVCVIAAATKPDSPARRPLVHLLKHGFPGKLYGVNPIGEVPEGVSHYKSVEELPEVPSLALILLSARDAPEALAACGRKGIKAAVVVSSGFEEIDGGGALAQRLLEASKLGCSLVVGPNSEGLWSLPGKAVLSHGSAARRDRIIEGPVSILSQSGSIGAACLTRIQDWGVGCRFFVSVGNETVVNMLDYLEFIIEEGGTRVCALFVEGFKNAQRLRSLLERAHQRGIRIVALKGGMTLEGRHATQSHTGKMSSPGDIYSSIFKQFGILEAQNLREFFDLVAIAALDNHCETIASDAGVGIVAFSGGCRALIVDRMMDVKLPIAQFSNETEGALRSLLPSFAYVKNPVDPSNIILRNPDMLMSVVRPILEDSSVGAFILQYPNWSEDQVREHIGYQLDELASLMHRHRKPVIVSLLGMDFSKEFRADFIRRGIALARDPADAVRLVECMREFARFSSHSQSNVPAENKSDTKDVFKSPKGALTWADQMNLLRVIGLDVPPWKIANDSAQVDDALTHLHFPIVAKSAATEILHKSDLGLVKLDITNVAGAKAAMQEIQKRQPGPTLFQEMVKGTEILLSVIQDADFGPVLCLAKGGLFVEHSTDRAYLACPATEKEIGEAIERAKLTPLLSGLRGQMASDIKSLVNSAVRLSEFFAKDNSFDLIELNPVIVRAEGQGTLAVDVVTINRDVSREVSHLERTND